MQTEMPIEAHARVHGSTSTTQPGLRPAAGEPRGGASSRSRAGWVARGARAATPAKLRPVARETSPEACPVCSCREVRLDEVELGPRMKLAECPRCEHRWTTPVATTRLAPERRRMAVVTRASVDAAAQA